MLRSFLQPSAPVISRHVLEEMNEELGDPEQLEADVTEARPREDSERGGKRVMTITLHFPC